jgi:hypothetical protein
MSRPARAVHLPAAVTFGAALGLLGCYGWSLHLEHTRLAALDLPASGPVALRIDLPFVPEAFTITRLQAAGRLVRIEGSHAWLRDVPPSELHALAREYWIGAIHVWDGR